MPLNNNVDDSVMEQETESEDGLLQEQDRQTMLQLLRV